MAKKDSLIDGILKAMAIIGGAWLTIEVLKAIGKKTVFYDCPNCGNDIEYNQYKCDVCGTKLDWGEVKLAKERQNES